MTDKFDAERAVALATQGWTNKQIAEEMGYSIDLVMLLLGAVGIHRTMRRAQRQRMNELFSQGVPIDEIANEVGLTPDRVKQLMRGTKR